MIAVWLLVSWKIFIFCVNRRTTERIFGVPFVVAAATGVDNFWVLMLILAFIRSLEMELLRVLDSVVVAVAF